MNQNLNDLEITYWLGYMLHSLDVPYDLLNDNGGPWDTLCEEYTLIKMRSVDNID